MLRGQPPILTAAKLFVWPACMNTVCIHTGWHSLFDKLLLWPNRRCSFTIDHFSWKRKRKFAIFPEKIIMSQFYVNNIMLIEQTLTAVKAEKCTML